MQRIAILWAFLAAATAASAQGEVLVPGPDGDLLACSGSGDRVAVGLVGVYGSPDQHILVFDHQGGSWVVTADLTQPGTTPVTTGALDISDDGQTIVVGNSTWGTPAQGAAFVFRQDTSGWQYTDLLLDATPTIQPKFGADVAVDADGDVVAVADLATVGANVHVFELQPDGSWTLFELPGKSRNVSLSDAGDRLVHGSAGAAIYARTATDWVLEDGFSVPGALYAYSDVSDDGQRAAASIRHNGGDVLMIRGRTPSGWVDELVLPLGNGGAGHPSLDFDATGERLLAGRYDDRVYRYRRTGGSWSLEEVVLWPDGPVDTYGSNFGGRVEASDDFSRWFTLSELDQTTLWVFDPAQPIVYCQPKPTAAGCTLSIGYTGLPSLSAPVPFEVTVGDVTNFKNGLCFYGTSGPQWLPVPAGLFCASPPFRRTPLQNSGGNPPPAGDCSGSFAFDFSDWALSGLDANLVPGTIVSAQYWVRDPNQPDGTGSAFSNALQFTLTP